MSKSADDVLAHVCGYSKLDRHTLCMYSSDRHVLGWRRVAAYLLSELWDDNDHGRVQQRLHCSQKFVEDSIKFASEASAEGEAMRERLRSMGFEAPEPAAAPLHEEQNVAEENPTATPKLNVLQALVLQAAEEQFQASQRDLVKPHRRLGLEPVRRVVAFVASNVSMTHEEIALMLNCKVSSVQAMLITGSYDYMHDEEFKDNVDAMCTRLGVKARIPA